MPLVSISAHRLEYEWAGPPASDAPTLVFLHEGLGSTRQWKDFPATLCARTGCGGLVYSRLGHGGSDPHESPRSPQFMHAEAFVWLPELLRTFEIVRPIFVGHSDGASIALIYTGCGLAPVSGLILEAPHVFIEDVTVESIARIRSAYETTDLKARLARYHGSNTERMFRGWTDIWLHPEFRNWNIEEHLPGVRCPVMILQGEDDEYGTSKQIQAIATQVSGELESVLLAECGHAPHVDQRTITEDTIVRFVNARVLSKV